MAFHLGAAWSGCQMVAPWYQEAATALKAEGIRLGAMNMDIHGERGASYGVTGVLASVLVSLEY
jgi:hypothetical protein